MSLVSEALRKARQRSDAGAEGGQGAVVPPSLVLPPRRQHSGMGVAPLLLVAIAAGLGGAAGVWWAIGQRREPAPRESPEASSRAVMESPTPSAGPATVPTPPPLAAEGGPAAAAPAGAIPGEPAATPVSTSGTDTAAPLAPTSGPGDERSGDAAAGQPRERSFLIDADLGYAKLHLDYLVYRPGSPFGRVNGQDVVVGTTVEGFIVEEITADHIKLADKRHTVILRVR